MSKSKRKSDRRSPEPEPRGAFPSARSLLLVAAAALLPYLLLPPNGFFSDARKIVPQNKIVQEGSVGEILTHDFWGLPMDAGYATRSYRPLVSLTYAMTYRLFGLEPRAYHLGDMAIHAAAAVLFALLLSLLLPESRWVVPGAVLFAVHPVSSEAVCSFVGRADLMAGAFILGALVLHLGADKRRRPWLHEIFAVLLIVAALFSKEYAVSAPFIFLTIDLARHVAGRIDGPEVRRRVAITVAGLFAVLGLYLGVRFALAGALGGVPMLGEGDMPLLDKSLSVRWGTAAWLLLPALRLMLWPVSLNYFYGKGTLPLATGLADPRALAGAALVAVLAVLAWRSARRGRVLPAVGFCLGLMPLGVTLNTVSVSGVLFAERFLYLPLAGLIAVVCLLLERGVRNEAGRRAGLIALASVCVVFTGMTMVRVHQWSAVSRLVDSSLESFPDSANANFEKALILSYRNNPDRDLERAVEYYKRSLLVEDRRPQVWTNYARALDELGRFEDAVKARRRAIELSPGDVEPLWRWLGKAELKVGNLGAAITAFRRAVELVPDQPEARVYLANALLREGQTRLAEGDRDGALERVREADALGDLPPEAKFLAGQLAWHSGESGLAGRLLGEASAEKPGLLRARNAEAIELEKAGKHLEAASVFREILAARPGHAHTLFNLGRSLVLGGRPEEAIAPLREGLGITDDPNARRWLARARREASFGVSPKGAGSWE